MTTQHAEEAFEEIADLDDWDRSEPEVISIIDKHICAAIDEATAPLKARVEALEGLGPLIEEYIAAVNRQVYLEDQSGEMIDLSLQIRKKMTGGAT